MKTFQFTVCAMILVSVVMHSSAQPAKRMIWFGNSLTGCGYNTVQPMVNCTTNCGVAEPSGMKLKITPVDVPSCWLDCHENQGAFSKIDSGHYDLVYAQDNTENWIFGSTASSRVGASATYMSGQPMQKTLEASSFFHRCTFQGAFSLRQASRIYRIGGMIPWLAQQIRF
jgi:hypothetical protein